MQSGGSQLAKSMTIIATASILTIHTNHVSAQPSDSTYVNKTANYILTFSELINLEIFGTNIAKAVKNRIDATVCGSSVSYTDRNAFLRCISKQVSDAALLSALVKSPICRTSIITAATCLGLYIEKDGSIDKIASVLFPNKSGLPTEYKQGSWIIRRFVDYRRSYATNQMAILYGSGFSSIQVECGKTSSLPTLRFLGGKSPSLENNVYQHMDDTTNGLFATNQRGYVIDKKGNSAHRALLSYDAAGLKTQGDTDIFIDGDGSSSRLAISGYKDVFAKIQKICNGENEPETPKEENKNLSLYKDAALEVNKFTRRLTSGKSGCNGPFTGGPVAAAEAKINGGITTCTFSLYQTTNFVPLDIILSVHPHPYDKIKTWKVSTSIPSMYLREKMDLSIKYATELGDLFGITKSKHPFEMSLKLLQRGHFKINNESTHFKTYLTPSGMAYIIEVCPNGPCE